jgi:hypothetical protein
MTLRLRFPALCVSVSLAACSSSSVTETTGFSGAPLVTCTSSGGSLAVALRTSPQPPTEGVIEAQLTVTQAATGAPVDGLSITVVPWMPSMGMGTSVVPTVTATGDGTYQVQQVSVTMTGEWELRLTFAGPVSDTADPSFDVQ